jgi:uncharacterized membrane protein
VIFSTASLLCGVVQSPLMLNVSRRPRGSGTSDHEKRHQERIETMIKHSIEINRPAEEVFAYLDHVDRHNKWQAQLVSTSVETDRPIRVGTRVVERRNVPGGTRDFPYEITEHDRARKISFRGTAGLIRPAGTYTVEPTGESRSRLSSELDLEGHGVGKLFAILARRQAAKQVPVDQEKLKELLESGVALSTSSGSEAA